MSKPPQRAGNEETATPTLRDLDYPSIGRVDLGTSPAYGGRHAHWGPDTPRNPMHRHSEMEFDLVTTGWATYVVDGRRYDFGPHTLVWLFPEQEHILTHRSADFSMWVVHVTQRMLRLVCRSEEYNALKAGNAPALLSCRLPITQLKSIDGALSELTVVGSNPRYTDYYNAGLAHIALKAWTLQMESNELDLGRQLHPAVSRALQMINTETEPLSLQIIAHEVGISPRWLASIFLKQVGVSVLDFRDRTRLDRFFRIYEAEHASLPFSALKPETALTSAIEAGFGSYAQFYRVFRKVYGRSLRQFTRDS